MRTAQYVHSQCGCAIGKLSHQQRLRDLLKQIDLCKDDANTEDCGSIENTCRTAY
jgi:hypothetical protein